MMNLSSLVGRIIIILALGIAVIQSNEDYRYIQKIKSDKCTYDTARTSITMTWLNKRIADEQYYISKTKKPEKIIVRLFEDDKTYKDSFKLAPINACN